MYLDYFGLEKEPFTISPDPSFLYPSLLHRQALAHLKYGLEREGGFILLTGEVGTGKTTLTRLLLQQLPGNIRVAYILNARLGEDDLLGSICQELGLSIEQNKATVPQYIDLLNKNLLAAHADGKKTLLVIEEAQNLSPEVLEMLRLLTNLETNTAKLLHILLVAQPELLEVIGRPELRQLNQRVISRCNLLPLSLVETSNYLKHRLRRAGCDRPVFDQKSVREIHRISGGIPRLINLLAERCLLGAYSSSNVGVSKETVRVAASEVLSSSDFSSKVGSRFPLFSAIAVTLLICVLAAFWYGSLGIKTDLVPIETEEVEIKEIEIEVPVLAQTQAKTSPAEQQTEESLLIEPSAQVEPPLLPPVVPLNAYSQLLALWSIDHQAMRQAELCSLVNESGLACQVELDLGIERLMQMQRPGLVRVHEDSDQVSTYLLTSADEKNIWLSNTSGSRVVELEQFVVEWDGYFLYVWRPPPGYLEPLRTGIKAASVVEWLQGKISVWDSGYEELITGGIYTAAISEQVKRFQSTQGIETDGVLGPVTIMAFNDLYGDSPNLEVER